MTTLHGDLPGWIPVSLPAFSNSGTCLKFTFTGFSSPHPPSSTSWCPWTRKLLSLNTWLIPHNPAIGGCRTAIASLQFLPKLLNSSSGPNAHTNQRGGFGILQQKCSVLRTGVSFAPCVCEKLSLQPAATKHHGWKFKLQICSVHITSITLEKSICWTSFKPIQADNLNAVCQTNAGETAALQSLLQNGTQNFKLSLTPQTLVRSNCQES